MTLKYTNRTVRGLLWCCSTNGSKFVDRDFNASKNMVKCYHAYPNRPEGMDRDLEAQEEPKPKYINKKWIEDEDTNIENRQSLFFNIKLHESLSW